jgi:hypothetical protein
MTQLPPGCKLTPEVHKLLVREIAKGRFIEDACKVAGVSYDSYNRWYKKGKDTVEGDGFLMASEPFRKFRISVDTAMVAKKHQYEDLLTILADDYKDRDPKTAFAIVKFIMTAHYKEYREKSGFEISGPDGGPLKTENVGEATVSKEKIKSMMLALQVKALDEIKKREAKESA